jgi:hypothetical protein
MVRPGGDVPDASAQVKGPLPPVEVSVVEYETMITAAGSAVEVMTSGAIGIGGLPVPQERANPHRNKQLITNKERKSAPEPGHQCPHGPNRGEGRISAGVSYWLRSVRIRHIPRAAINRVRQVRRREQLRQFGLYPN